MKVIENYDDNIKIIELKDKLRIAIDKLKLYISLNESAASVSSVHKY